MTEILDTYFIPQDVNDRKRLKDAIEEASGLKQLAKDKADQIKDISDFVKDEFGMPKTVFRELLKIRFTGKYDEYAANSSAVETAHELLFPNDS
jgi:hypothetical protein